MCLISYSYLSQFQTSFLITESKVAHKNVWNKNVTPLYTRNPMKMIFQNSTDTPIIGVFFGVQLINILKVQTFLYVSLA
jgi:hypothetical protein